MYVFVGVHYVCSTAVTFTKVNDNPLSELKNLILSLGFPSQGLRSFKVFRDLPLGPQRESGQMNCPFCFLNEIGSSHLFYTKSSG